MQRFYILVLFALIVCWQCTMEESASESSEYDTTMPWTRWWWQGSAVTPEGISHELETLKAAGIGGVELTPIYGVIGAEDDFVPYLSPRWMELLEHTIKEAQRLGMGVDMATGTGWPFGGPWIGDEDACKYLVYKTWEIKGGGKLETPLQYNEEPLLRSITNHTYPLYHENDHAAGQWAQLVEQFNPDAAPSLELKDIAYPISANSNLQELAIDQIRYARPLPLVCLMAYGPDDEVLDLTERISDSGYLDWTAPAGRWQLYALWQGWHGKMVERAAPGGEGNVIDHFSAQALENYLNRFDSAFAGANLGHLRAFFNDSYEVDDARGQSDWTPEFLQAFEQRRGYDFRHHLPAWLGESSDTLYIEAIRSDVRATMGELILEDFTLPWNAWAAKYQKVIRNQSHGSPGNLLDLYAASDIPETEGTNPLRIRFATSAAHVSGKQLVSAEAATWLNEHFQSTLGDLKVNLDRYLTSGVNHLFYHGTCYSPADDPWPGRLFYAAIHANDRNSWWPDFTAFNAYVARVQRYLQSGTPDQDVLVYFPIYDWYAGRGDAPLRNFQGEGHGLEEMPVMQLAASLLDQGFAYDLISDDQIARLQVKDGHLSTGGINYKTLIVPSSKYLPFLTLQYLYKQAEAGAHIIFQEKMPEHVAGWFNRDTLQASMEFIKQHLDWQNTSIGKEATVGKGRFTVTDQPEEACLDAGAREESLTDLGLEFTRRQLKKHTCYFIVNSGAEEINTWVPIHTEAQAWMAMDPMQNLTTDPAWRQSEDGWSEVYLYLPAGASLILLSDTLCGQSSWYPADEDPAIPVSGSWQLTFDQGGPELPSEAVLDKLMLWTDLDGLVYSSFSGSGTYTISLSRPATSAEGWILDLGEVAVSAEVKINQDLIGTAVGPEFKLHVPNELWKDNNILIIRVSNLMANRIADMDRRRVFWKRFYNINFPPRLADNRGALGLFDAANWEAMPSGLAGPVRLIPATTKP